MSVEVPEWYREYYEEETYDMLVDDFEKGHTSRDELWYAYVIEGSDVDAEHLSTEEKNSLLDGVLYSSEQVVILGEKYGDSLDRAALILERLISLNDALFEETYRKFNERKDADSR